MAQAREKEEAQNVQKNDIFKKYKLSESQLHTIRLGLLSEMGLGLKNQDSNKNGGNPSTCKMLSSHVFNVPTGKESGKYYTLDWGGTNYRVLRMELLGRKDGYKSKQKIEKITKEYRQAKDAVMLFDYLTGKLKDFMIEEKEEHGTCDPNVQFPIGFCFSFPMYQPSLQSGILVEWTKGFTVPNVVGKDVSTLMNDAFKRAQMNNVVIDSVVNDTVGTLLACAYEHENTRVGLILGTGSNCAYIDPTVDNEVINVEWGNFGSDVKRLGNVLSRVEIDNTLDAMTSNKGAYFAEKMISGKYLGELVRFAVIEQFGDKILQYKENSILNQDWKFKSWHKSMLLEYEQNNEFDKIESFLKQDCGLKDFSSDDCKLFVQICQLITYRSADVAAAMLTAVLEKTGLYVTKMFDESDEKGNGGTKCELTVNEKYSTNDNKYVTIGIDGSVYNKDSIFRERMHQTLKLLLGDSVYEQIRMEKSDDGSGKGAALAACGNKASAQKQN